jgi:hypothetical protein
METTRGPVPVTARSAARRAAARAAGSAAASELTNGATWAMPSRQATSSAGVLSPVGTAITEVRTRAKPAAAACPASSAGSPARDPGASDAYHAGGR